MNRYGKYSTGAAGDAGQLARSIHCRGKCALRISPWVMRSLKRSLQQADMLRGGCEAMRILKAESIRLQEFFCSLRGLHKPVLPGEKGTARILHLARLITAGGEERLDADQILCAAAAFGDVQDLQMQEIHALENALRIALCEALERLCGEIIACSRDMLRAENWVNGSWRCGKLSPAFCAHALKLAAEAERPELHVRLEKRIEQAGSRSDFMLDTAHGMAAEYCLRLSNLMHLRRLLDEMNWEECFERLCGDEHELRQDPADIYARMDAESRDAVRRDAALLASDMNLSELTVVRYALQLAASSAKENGMKDPRSTVCWYLSDDAGRVQLCAALGRDCPRRCIPDASGGKTVLLATLSTLLVAALLACLIGKTTLLVYAVLLAWVPAMQLIGKFYPRRIQPRRMLKMKIDRLPECAKTLVVLPVLLSSEKRAGQMLARMEALGCMENDENIDFLLLGDFRDACADVLEDDAAILDCVRSGVERLNGCGRRKYFYLHRSRSWREQDGRWVGKNRKRGALMALNRLLLGSAGAENAFEAENRDAQRLIGQYRYVVTLDADTEYLPGCVQKLAGAMLHPLNRSCIVDGKRRGYAVLQPSMLLTARSTANAYVRRRFGEGGLDGYPLMLSEFFQDMTGKGCFAGKGIYDVQAFAQATENVLNDDKILSHDLIEGILCGAAGINDVFFYDGCPENLRSDLTRLHRWTRGDWQLLPVLFSRISFSGLDRLKMLSNLLRSLYAPLLLGLLVHSAWLDAPAAFAAGLLLAFQNALLYPGMDSWKRCLLDLAVLPAQAFCQADAILRTLWRLAVSGKHLMDWVPAADTGNSERKTSVPGRTCAILLAPALLRMEWIVPVLAMGALFWVGADWADDLANAKMDCRKELSADQRDMLMEIARRTWRFFEEIVPMDGCGLPPDNLQLDPPAGTAMRTSPTNIGLYLMSCLSAWHLGFISRPEMLARMERTIITLEKLKKWNGHLYNWYDLNTLESLQPGYVSSVDSGNLAGALLLCAHALKDTDAGGRLQRLAEDMNLAALYDEQKHLFFIGIDTENNRLSRNHYDLYASESRILSYCAMMLGQVPLKHWRHLGRTFVRCARHSALLSWSGTMFETLMPELLLRSPENTLSGLNRRGTVAAQMDLGKRLNRPWGVSESGYYAFDLHLNYQYRAFGLKRLALNPAAVQDVIAPYAAALALMVFPDAAARNLKTMCELGWMGELGMYEAADYQDGEKPRIVRSHMAHHQGMVLCAVCNALRDDVLSRSFMDIPRAKALQLLLEERIPKTALRRERKAAHSLPRQRSRVSTDFMRRSRQDQLADTHLMHGGGATVLANNNGAAYVWKDGIQLNRFFGNLRDHHHGMYVHISDGEGDCVIGEDARVCYDAGYARYSRVFRNVEVCLTITVSPEDGCVYQQLRLHNQSKEARDLEITGCLTVALAAERDMRAHPVFQNLFVETGEQEGVLLFHRRSRKRDAQIPWMVYLLGGAECTEFETDLEKLVGRTGSVGGSISGKLSGSMGNVLNPCAAIRTRIHLLPDESRNMHFALTLAAEAELDSCIRRNRLNSAPERALQLCAAQTRSVLGHTGIDARMFHLLGRSAALMVDAGLRCCVAKDAQVYPQAKRDYLWQAGISGDLPVLLVEISDLSGMDCVRDAIRMHAFYRNMGMKMDFVLIDHHGSDYLRPSRNALSDLISSSHLNGSFACPGGAFILDRQNLNSDSYAAITRFAFLRLDAQRDSVSQLQAMLDHLALPSKALQAQLMRGNSIPDGNHLRFFNGYGGFDDGGYVILLKNGILPPAPWSNVLACGEAGAIVTERGGGFCWMGNSRHDRLTAFENDPLQEGWGWMFYLLDEQEGSYMPLLPGNDPAADFIVRHEPGKSSWIVSAGDISSQLEMRAEKTGVRFEITLENNGKTMKHLRLAALVNWLMGTDSADAAMLRCWPKGGTCFAAGTAGCIGVFACDDPRCSNGCDRQSLLSGGDMLHPRGMDRLNATISGWTLHLPLLLSPGERRSCRFLLGGAKDWACAQALAKDFRSGEALRRSAVMLHERLGYMQVTTPDEGLNLLMNAFLPAQVMNARILGRTGLYQGGGAYGFRDQLQDMLPMIHYAPEMVRAHLLRCAARQFEDGDVLHWWHEPYNGVRTKISDDLLFLPFVAAQYVSITGDTGILNENAPFLKDIAIPEGQEDIYAPMQPTAHTASLHRHCMLALRRAGRTGQHGLCRMGSGDWNDGMNRIGVQGRGESVWLSQFLSVCAEAYAAVCPEEGDKKWLLNLSRRLKSALEENGWDGRWYLRAYDDEGRRIGSSEGNCCRIDLISQAWAVLAGLDENRCRSAMDEAWKQLADEDIGIIRLLAPPFDGRDYDPGYIAAYPPGIRENGAQYTHAACWMLCALAAQGDAQRAHRALDMLLPLNHARTKQEADLYRVEPYVMAADIYAGEKYAGRGGWTWYTGSAAWMMLAVWQLMGFARRKNRVRLHALLHNWPQVEMKLRHGMSSYTLICRQDVQKITLDGKEIDGEDIEMIDDGRDHIALFPPRTEANRA